MADTPKSNEERWPAVISAYDFVQPSYALMATRVEAVVTRIQALMTFSATITLGFAVLGQAIHRNISYFSAPFAIAVGFFILLMALGIVARDLGELMLTSPGKIYDSSLHLSEWEFKRNSLFLAGKSFDHNLNLIARKSEYGRAMSILLLGEVVSFLAWFIWG